MVTSSEKRAWHDRMRERAWRYAETLCVGCGSKTEAQHGVIHHTDYPAGVYAREVESLMDEGVCVWLCRQCHEQMHLAETGEETHGTVKNAGRCFHCGRIAYGGWDRAQSLGLEHCICKACHQAQARRQQAEEAGQMGMFREKYLSSTDEDER